MNVETILWISVTLVLCTFAVIFGVVRGYAKGRMSGQMEMLANESEQQENAWHLLEDLIKNHIPYARIVVEITEPGPMRGRFKEMILKTAVIKDIEALQQAKQKKILRHVSTQALDPTRDLHQGSIVEHLQQLIGAATLPLIKKLVDRYYPKGVSREDLRQLLTEEVRNASSEGMKRTIMPSSPGAMHALRHTLLPTSKPNKDT